MKDFHKVLNSESANIKDLSMAVKGFGVFAEVRATELHFDLQYHSVLFSKVNLINAFDWKIFVSTNEIQKGS